MRLLNEDRHGAARGKPVAGSRVLAISVTARVLPSAWPTDRAIELTALATPVSSSGAVLPRARPVVAQLN